MELRPVCAMQLSVSILNWWVWAHRGIDEDVLLGNTLMVQCLLSKHDSYGDLFL